MTTHDEGTLEGLVSVTRRDLLHMVGAGLSLAALEGCARQPNEKIVPYVRAPEELVPGRPLFYASTLLFGGYGTGVLVESHMGRPTKIEGNQNHPASRGGTDAFMQASLRTLYDPDRSPTVSAGGRISNFDALVEELVPVLKAQRVLKGAGLRIVTPLVTSPSLGDKMRALLSLYPSAKWYRHEPTARDNARIAAIRAHQRPFDVHHRFDQADVIVSLDADYMIQGPQAVRAMRDIAARRRYRDRDRGAADKKMNRLYHIESAPTITGAKADHRLSLPPSAIPQFAKRLAKKLGLGFNAALEATSAEELAWVEAVADDLSASRGRSIVIAGDGQPPAVHMLAEAMNFALGNVGRTVFLVPPAEEEGARTDLEELAEDMEAGAVQLLVILEGANPVYSTPGEIRFVEAMPNVALRVHHGLLEDETSAHCHWHVPACHELESWSDARAFDGTLSVVQPLIAPLFAGKTALEIVSALLGEPHKTSFELVRESWKKRLPGALDQFEKLWETVLHDGLLQGSSSPALNLGPPNLDQLDAPIRPARAEGASPRRQKMAQDGEKTAAGKPIEVTFRPDPTIQDGRFSNNAWLQEVPKPFSKITWENAVWLGPKTARSLSLTSGDRVELGRAGHVIRGPVWVVPGHAEGAATVFLGYGRTRAGRSGSGLGYDAYLLRSVDSPDLLTGVPISKIEGRTDFSITQEEKRMHDRKMVRSGTLETFTRTPDFAQKMEEAPPRSLSLVPELEWPGNQWGMSIDLSTCTGCSACLVACQAENNIPTVGKEMVRAGREMHWIRIDQYFIGSEDSPEIVNQPVPCMHCENAPCELVCPVEATLHSPNGLNEMVYNRCVGTRYCSNNCPYKVRRFNFFHYTENYPDVLKMLMNPDVTVRGRGVMEKCSYCVQRINHARIDAKREGRSIMDGEIVTACEGACPAQAIVFGDIADADTRVSQAKREPLTYGMLADLNTRPRTTYMARLTNPNPKLAGKTPETGGAHGGRHE